MSDCEHNCGSCGQDCAERTEPADMKVKPHKFSTVKKVIGVVSGKGGVGKSLVTGLLASKMQSRGSHAAVLDADITGHHYVVGGAPDIGAYEATCLNPIGSVVYVRSGPAGTASNPQTTYFGTGDGSSWSNAINGNAWYGFDDGLPYDQIEYDSSDATDFITGLQYAVNAAYKASLKKEANGSIAYKTLNYYELGWWSGGRQVSVQIPEVDTTALVEVWVAEGEYTSRRGFFMRDAVQVYGGFPGTGTPEAGGVTFSQLLEAIQMVAKTNVVGADVNELAPMLDQSGVSTATACKVLRELLLALSK